MQKLKKPTESNLLLSTMIFLLLIISCVIGIWIRGINNLERFYVLNIGLDLVGMVVVYVIFCSCLFDQEKKISDILIFIALLFSAFAGYISIWPPGWWMGYRRYGFLMYWSIPFIICVSLPRHFCSGSI